MYDVQGQLDRKWVTIVSGVFVDLTKALDTIHHEQLLGKLHCAGIRGVVWEHFTCRGQMINVNGCFSPPTNIGFGVPRITSTVAFDREAKKTIFNLMSLQD